MKLDGGNIVIEWDDLNCLCVTWLGRDSLTLSAGDTRKLLKFLKAKLSGPDSNAKDVMKVTSTYTNVDKPWLEWWLKHLANEEVMPGSTVIAEELRESGYAVFSSKDPTSPVCATTEYLVDPGDGRADPKEEASK